MSDVALGLTNSGRHHLQIAKPSRKAPHPAHERPPATDSAAAHLCIALAPVRVQCRSSRSLHNPPARQPPTPATRP